MNTAAKDLRKNYSKKICEKLVLLMKTTIRALANHFKANCNCVISLLIKTDQAASGDESILSAECKSMEQYTAGEIIFVLETFLSFPKIEVNILLCLRQQELFTSVITSLNTLSSCSSICVF